MKIPKIGPGQARWYDVLTLFLSGILIVSQANAADITVNVVDGAGQPVPGFRWILEEDNTHPVTPGKLIDRAAAPAENMKTPNNKAEQNTSLSFDFHGSHAPVAVDANGNGLQGNEISANATISAVTGSAVDKRRYYVSVLPYTGYTMGGAPVLVDSAAEVVTVIVQSTAMRKTAQISVLVFEDTRPLNGMQDLPVEGGLGGLDWHVKLFEAAGSFGIAGGQVLQDAFGNPLGTEYAPGDSSTILSLGDGTLHPDPVTGTILIKNLVPAKYGVQIVPPATNDPKQKWIQTSTIEGTKTIDAWVKAGEPSFFQEFGPPNHHASFGFAKRDFEDLGELTGSTSITGIVTNLHTSRPPNNFEFFSAQAAPGCYVGLNDLAIGARKVIYTKACNEDSSFSIDGVKDGNYQVVVFDANLDLIIALLGVSIGPNDTDTCGSGTAECKIGLAETNHVPVFNWYGRLIAEGFNDVNENGFRDIGETNMPLDSTALHLRFRNGMVYQSFPVDSEGFAPFDEVFPFFHWLVAEIDFAGLKATGATFTIDGGGETLGAELNPQAQVGLSDCSNPALEECTVDGLSRTERGPVLTQGFQQFLGQTSIISFGKNAYGTNENGGISGVIANTVTRAENDPAYAAIEEWEALIPRVQVNLYQDNLDNATGLAIFGGDGVIDPIACGGSLCATPVLADVDNYPLGWADGLAKGPEDVDHNSNGTFDKGDAIEVTWSDSWDDSKPSNCQGGSGLDPAGNGLGFEDLDCFDGIRNFNQIRPGVFDGGYAFGPTFDCTSDNLGGCTEADYLKEGADGAGYLASGQYIVMGEAPPGYRHIREEDKNVDFGDEVVPQLLPPECIGAVHTVQNHLSFQTDDSGNALPGIASADLIASPFAGQLRPSCDTKTIRLAQGKNAALDFQLMTETPKAARVVGFILNDVGNEFDPKSANFGEKFAPPWLPISFRDFTGTEFQRTYSDEFGKYNALLPSTYNVAVPVPSGVGPNMVTSCMNSSNPIPNPAFDPNGVQEDQPPEFITDPFHNPQFSQFCYTFQFMPGATTYLDTPVVPIAAFAGDHQFPLDCEYGHQTPMIASVQRANNNGGGGPFALPGQKLVIKSRGSVDVPNPAYNTGPGGIIDLNKTIARNYRFGPNAGARKVELIDSIGVHYPLSINVWNGGLIRATIPASTPVNTYQLVVTRDNGNKSPMGVTVTVGDSNGKTPSGGDVINVAKNGTGDFTTIQAAIDDGNTIPGDLILVGPGIYEELVVMYKPVSLQGWGASVTTISAIKSPAEKLQLWRDKINALFGPQVDDTIAGINFDLVAGQELGFIIKDNESIFPRSGEGPGIFVVAHRDGGGPNDFKDALDPRIDGFTITGGDTAGGIVVNGYADHLRISNNRIRSNGGSHGGGIRIGDAVLTFETGPTTLGHSDAHNDNITVAYNDISNNGNFGGAAGTGAGGAISIYTGADNYQVTDNYICGNFSQTNGGGIGHLGLSDNGLIKDNTIIFNQSFNQGLAVSGGGVFVAGKPDVFLLGQIEDPTTGSGSVAIVDNLIQGNQAGTGDGGGIQAQNVNGLDVVGSNDPADWHGIDIFGNRIVNNMAGLAGAGISLQDTAKTRITNNTVANNDSTATASLAFDMGPNQSSPQVAGIALRRHSGLVLGVLPGDYSKPELFKNNIIWHNRSFYFKIDGANFGLCPALGTSTVLGCGSTPIYDDLKVLNASGTGLEPRYTVFSSTYSGTGSGHGTNKLEADAGLIADYVNGDRGQTIQQPEIASSIQAAVAFDEGGNFIDIRFGPLSLNVDAPLAGAPSDYHLEAGSPAIDEGNPVPTVLPLLIDFDGDNRNPEWSIGADEFVAQ